LMIRFKYNKNESYSIKIEKLQKECDFLSSKDWKEKANPFWDFFSY